MSSSESYKLFVGNVHLMNLENLSVIDWYAQIFNYSFSTRKRLIAAHREDIKYKWTFIFYK